MTASSTARHGLAGLPETSDLGSALQRLARAATRYAETKLSTWTDQIKGLAEPTGPTDRALVEGLKAWATGRNPATAALHGAWIGADGKTKAAIVAVLVLAVVLAPLLALVILIALLVIALVHKARAASAGSG